MQTVAKFFHDGGNLMLVNLGVLVLALAIIAERLYMIGFRLRVNSRVFLQSVEKLVIAGNIDRAIKLCAANPGAALPRVARAALSNARMGGPAITAAVEETMLEVLPKVMKRAGVLFGIANVATLIGLVGTVFGLIQAFAAINLATPDKKTEILTGGIAHAMNNTAWGLSIALVCIMFHMVLTVLTKGIIDNLEHGAVRIENMLAKRQLGSGAAGAEPPPAPHA